MKNGEPYAFKVVTYFGIRVIRKLVKKFFVEFYWSMVDMGATDGKDPAVSNVFYFNALEEGLIPFAEGAYDGGCKNILGRVTVLVTCIGCAPGVHLEVLEFLPIFGFIHNAKNGVMRLKHFGHNKAHISVLMGQMCRASCKDGYGGEVGIMMGHMIYIGVVAASYII